MYKYPSGRLSPVTGRSVASGGVGSGEWCSLFLLARIFYDIGVFVRARLVIPFSVYLSPCGVMRCLAGIIPGAQRVGSLYALVL